MRQKIQNLLNQLNYGLVAREDTLKAVLLTVLAGENIVLIGPPGTGKSMLARRMADGLGGKEGLSYFEYLLTKFSTPEELFGPLSISALKQDRFHRNTAGYLPSVELAFLDEVFKASSSILNALLTLMNERLFHNGAHTERAPLRSLIAASNELPTGQEELAALYDRFLVRCFVDYVGEDKLHLLLAAPPASAAPVLDQHITQADIDQLQTAAQSVTLPAPIAQALQDIWYEHRQTFKEDRREQLSDRRLIKCLHLLRISAVTNGRAEVDLSDLLLLKNCLWNHPDNASKVLDLVKSVLLRHSYLVPFVQRALPQANDSVSTDLSRYEVAEDGSTLVPVQRTVSRSICNTAADAGRMDAAIKGWYGSGTAHDPLLIQSIEDWMDLARPEVGMQGHHFLLTKNLDLSKVTSWIIFEFSGFLDGGGFEILGSKKNKEYLKSSFENTNTDALFLFKKINKDSEITNLTMSNLALAKLVEEAVINRCSSDFFICETSDSSQIIFNESGNFLCLKAYDSIITGCSANTALIICTSIRNKLNLCYSRDLIFSGTNNDIEVKNCFILIKSKKDHRLKEAKLLRCKIENCYIQSKKISNQYLNLYSLGSIFSECTIKSVFFGEFTINDYGRWFFKKIESTITDNNYYLESKNFTNEALLPDSFKKIPTELLTRRFFINNLKWDFDEIWQWDELLSQPILRLNAHYENSSILSTIDSIKNMQKSKDSLLEDLLSQQVRCNIWL